MLTQEKVTAAKRLIFPLLAVRIEDESVNFNREKSLKQSFNSNTNFWKMDQESASLLACQEHPWLQRCGDTVDLCAGEAVTSPGKEDHVPSINELSATRHAERNSGRRNRRRHIRKQRKKSPTNAQTVHLDAIQIELDSPSPVETRNWALRSYNNECMNEDSFLTDDEAEMDEDDNNNYIDRVKFRNSSAWSTNLPFEAGDVTSDSGLENNHNWLQCGASTKQEKWEESDELSLSDCSPRQENTPRSSVLSSWMRVPCVGKHPLDFSYSIKKDYRESKKAVESSNAKSKKKRKKSKSGMRHFLASSHSEAASDSQELICAFNDGLKTPKSSGPVKWFRKNKTCKSSTKIMPNIGRPLPVDSLQLPAPEGSILKRPVASCQAKPKKKVRWASDLLQVRYFRSEPLVPSQYHSSPRRSGNRISSYDLDVLLFPWQEGNHSSRDSYMSFIQ